MTDKQIPLSYSGVLCSILIDGPAIILAAAPRHPHPRAMDTRQAAYLPRGAARNRQCRAGGAGGGDVAVHCASPASAACRHAVRRRLGSRDRASCPAAGRSACACRVGAAVVMPRRGMTGAPPSPLRRAPVVSVSRRCRARVAPPSCDCRAGVASQSLRRRFADAFRAPPSQTHASASTSSTCAHTRAPHPPPRRISPVAASLSAAAR